MNSDFNKSYIDGQKFGNTYFLICFFFITTTNILE